MSQPKEETLTIHLRDPLYAALLAWLLPGLGHLYQRRWAKGVLFMVCTLTIYFSGLLLGQGRVVYASFRNVDGARDLRLAFFCQMWVGAPALPAVIQAVRTGGQNPKAPLWPIDGKPGTGWMAPPRMRHQKVPAGMLPPNEVEPVGIWDEQEYVANREDELSQWNAQLGVDFELGTVYTMVAGLLNLLVMFDAWGGPVLGPAGKPQPVKDTKKFGKSGVPA